MVAGVQDCDSSGDIASQRSRNITLSRTPMPAKRPPTASPASTPKSKKPKAGQSNLDAFFGGSASASTGSARAGKNSDKGSASPSKAPKVSSLVAHEVIDVDLLYEDKSTIASSSGSLAPGVSTLQVADGRIALNRSLTPAALASPTKAKYAFMSADPNNSHSYQSLAVDPLAFGISNAPWPPNTAAPYSFLSHTLSTLSETRSRIVILNTLTNCLRTISRYDPPSLLPALYLMSNALSAAYLPIELGLGPSLISKAIQASSGLTSAALRQLYNSTGDVGDVAFQAKSNVRTLIPHPPLLIIGVYDALLKIANAKGTGAGKIKQSIVEKLLVAAKGEETRFLVRTLSMNLRVGAVRTSILTALARAMALTPPATIVSGSSEKSAYRVDEDVQEAAKSTPVDDAVKDVVNQKLAEAESLVKQIFVQHPNYDDIVAALLDGGLGCLSEKVPLTVGEAGIPLHPTLGSPTRSLDEVYERLGDLSFAAEYKYDGQRAQIHCEATAGKVTVRIFSRHLEDMTSKYPDVVSLMQEIFAHDSRLQSCILDSEIVAIDPADGALKSFQELSNRARKDVQIADVKVCVGIFAFDLMYLDGEILLEQAFRRRRMLLRERLPPFTASSPQAGVARFGHVESCESEDGREAIEEFWMRAVESRCEGLMIKLLDSGDAPEEASLKEKEKEKVRRKPLPATYRPDKRTSAWLKLKKDYVAGLGDSLDLV
ncbi:hypothetical protein HWV62_31447 [Athelia sp. TMB]|nr:hypothetical protein HWV62_31447 [Athelia sp. TMB]